MCEESGRQVGGQTDAAEGRAMDRRRDERCDESRDRRPDRHAAGVCLHVFVCACVRRCSHSFSCAAAPQRLATDRMTIRCDKLYGPAKEIFLRLKIPSKQAAPLVKKEKKGNKQRSNRSESRQRDNRKCSAC